jgi:hypothetical protein
MAMIARRASSGYLVVNTPATRPAAMISWNCCVARAVCFR